MKAFVARGVRAHHRPSGRPSALAAIVGAALIGATALAGPATAFPSGFVSPSSSKASIEQRIAAGDLLRDQEALKVLVRREADRSTDLDVDKGGRRTRYIVPDLDRAMLHHIAMVQQERDPADASTDPIYGLDDAAWSKMMMNHAAPVGLGKVMDGVAVDKDGRPGGDDPSKVAAMLDLKRNPVAATKVFAHWLATQIHRFDARLGRAPSPGEASVISMTNAWGGEFATVLNARKQEARLGPEIGIVARSWKYAFFSDGGHDGWLSTATAMARLEASAGRTWTDPDARIPVREAGVAAVGNSWTGQMRDGIGRLGDAFAGGVDRVREAAGDSARRFAQNRHDGDDAPPAARP